MTTDITPTDFAAAFPADWDVPGFRCAWFRPKSQRFALVIPVIDEGERIRGQLRRIADLDLPVDVILADGGSTDGSLDPEILAGTGVRLCLVKTGPGKLSAQLRMAYAVALTEGYAGVVTVDGNGKDGVEAVAGMLASLEDGADYVQGSRYAAGGSAENTPLARSFGNRMIHAPLLSLAGRRRLTDTTNGFRAYSARYLSDPRVKPFRDLFQAYELLFYLTVRAGQIGMDVRMIGVRRSYPASGKTPTKIKGLRAYIDVFMQTVAAALGRYAP